MRRQYDMLTYAANLGHRHFLVLKFEEDLSMSLPHVLTVLFFFLFMSHVFSA